MFFRKKKEVTLHSPRTIKILIIFLLVNMLYIGFWGGDGKENAPLMLCDAGPLSPMRACNEKKSPDAAPITWWFSDALGVLDKNVCRQMSMEEEAIDVPIARDKSVEKIIRTQCEDIGLSNDNFCYTLQYLSADGTKRHVSILTTSANCGNARYFRGINASQYGGEINTDLKPADKITGIAELTYN